MSNGVIGLRPTVDSESIHAIPGAFHAQLYAPSFTVRREIVNLPSWWALNLGTPQSAPDLDGPRLKSFSRRLDYRRGVLFTDMTVDLGGDFYVRLKRYDLTHAAQPDLTLTWGEIEGVSGAGCVTLTSCLDARHGNAYGGGFTRSTRLHHCVLDEGSASEESGLQWNGTIQGTERSFRIDSHLKLEDSKWRPIHRLRMLGEEREVNLAPGIQISFTRATRISIDAQTNSSKTETLAEMIAEHEAAWAERWACSEAEIEGDEEANARLQFSLFHLLQSMDAKAPETNIPARGLTSEYHSGHFFFNTEVFKLPYFLLTQPGRARALLSHRHERLDAARNHAADTGCQGARFPEEADIDGAPSAPFKIVDIYAGKEITEWSGPQTKFISALVALGADWYRKGVVDPTFAPVVETLISDAGAFGLSLLETAAHGYEISGVMCADEYHYDVSNDVFTNEIVRHSLKLAAAQGGEQAPMLEKGAEGLRAPRRMATGAICQFDGYEDLPDKTITAWNQNGRPHMDVGTREDADNLVNFKNKLIKEGDVIFIHDLLPGLFDDAQQLRDFDFYFPRTTMESSLSATPYALVASRLGRADLARQLFMLTAGYNIDFLPRETYCNGIHIAACGGAWRILVQGFLGQRFSDEAFDLQPAPLPASFKGLSLRLTWRGLGMRLHYNGDELLIAAVSGSAPITIRLRQADDVRETSLAPKQNVRFKLSDF